MYIELFLIQLDYHWNLQDDKDYVGKKDLVGLCVVYDKEGM